MNLCIQSQLKPFYDFYESHELEIIFIDTVNLHRDINKVFR